MSQEIRAKINQIKRENQKISREFIKLRLEASSLAKKMQRNSDLIMDLESELGKK